MSITVVEQLPLFRAKCEGIATTFSTGAGVGPGTYNVDLSPASIGNNSRAPFNTTAQRPPLSENDPHVPGPGRYDVSEPEKRSIGIASCPFVSESLRFPLELGGERPGPGSYNLQGVFPDKPTARVHTFSELPHGQASSAYPDSGLGPGYYSPNHAASVRAHPKAAQFSKYSARAPDPVSQTPGPGTYDLGGKPRSIYANKPSSMFATKTTRIQYHIKDTPGPGDYETSGSLLHRSPACSTGRSAFGTSAPRFNENGKDGPGPGWYTGEVAPRRPQFNGAANMHPFASSADRFYDTQMCGPGPGSYDGRKAPKHLVFGGEAPFGSTLPRFTSTMQRHPTLSFDQAFGQAGPRRPPRRTKPMRQFIAGGIKPTTQPEPLPERTYDVKYDWPKPESTRSVFGAAPRMAASAADNGVPGPGSYIADAATLHPERGKSNWNREVRFSPPGMERGGTIGPGRYYHDSTFLSKTFNCTIGSEPTW